MLFESEELSVLGFNYQVLLKAYRGFWQGKKKGLFLILIVVEMEESREGIMVMEKYKIKRNRYIEANGSSCTIAHTLH